MSKVIVITGCSSGIGLECAKYLHAKGLHVYPTARNTTDVKRLQEEGFSNALKLDVRDPDEIASVIKDVLSKEGRIDVWFNNAGYGQPGALEDLPLKALKDQFETNVFGLFECTRQVLEVMKKQGGGKIIQHSSVLGLVSLHGRGAYNASKYAVEGLSDTLRLELEGTHIKIITLNTGPVTSSFRKNALSYLKKHIDIDASRFSARYKNILQEGTHSKVPFNLPASAVAKILYTIIHTKNPKPRYYITKATYILGTLKRLLSTRMLDRILVRLD